MFYQKASKEAFYVFIVPHFIFTQKCVIFTSNNSNYGSKMIEAPFICRLDKDHINRHFAVNNTWKDIWIKYYGEDEWLNPDTVYYAKKAWKILEDCGFTYIIERYSDNPKSNVYQAVKELTIFEKNNICNRIEVFDKSYTNCIEQGIIKLVGEYRVDMRPFLEKDSSMVKTNESSRKYL